MDPKPHLIGVYHANGTLLGELSYVVGKLAGLTHCGLCDITHGGWKEKPGFTAWRTGAPLPFTAVHLDEQTPEVAAFTAGQTPCVVLQTGEDLMMLLDAAALDACGGSVRAFDAAVRAALEAAASRPAGP